MHQVIKFWTNLRASLWFVPGLIVTGSIALALGLIELDSRMDGKWLAAFPRIFGLGADGSRGMLTAIASSMLTVAALVFTMTLNAMTQASGQFTPRIFRNFMRDRANQFVLGYFVGVFVYCLLVLRTIRGGDEIRFVPSLAVIAGLLLALGGVVVLIFFIHHIADSLQITTIINNIADETKEAVERMFPAKLGKAAEPDAITEVRKAAENQQWRKVPAMQGGYLQSVDTDGLLEFAEGNKVILRMESGIGQFAGRGAVLLSLSHNSETENSDFALDEGTIKELNGLYVIDRHRTIEQDAGFGIRQIVDIALKALSPGVNDTTTAVTCIDFLGEIVGEIARRELPQKVLTGKNGGRVIVCAFNFQDYVEAAFDQIRISGKANLAIFERLLEAVGFVAECTDDKERLVAIKKQIELVVEFALQTLETDHEREKLEQKVVKVRLNFAK